MVNFEWKKVYRVIFSLFEIAIVTFMFSVPWLCFVKENNNTGHLLGVGNIAMALGLYSILFIISGVLIDAFKVGVIRKASLIASNILTLIIVDFIEVFLSIAITGNFRYFFAFAWRYVLLFLVQGVVIGFFDIIALNIYRAVFPPLNLLEVNNGGSSCLKCKMESIPSKYQIVDEFDYKNGITELRELIERMDGVVISDIPSHEKNLIIKLCVDMDKRVYFVPKISDVIVKYSSEVNLFDTPLYLTKKVGIGFFEGLIKRSFDIILSFVMLIVLSPLLLITALAIKIEDRGPVFFRQERITLGSKRFMIIKFRSMIPDAEKDGKPHPAGEHDDRITKVGRIIRATRVDELPQLLNILKGDMSVVGPRPERVEHVEKYAQEIPEFSFRTKVKGGLTGYAQVYGKYNTTALDKLKMDLEYILHFSLLLDLQILFETLKIIFQKESTEGFSEERIDEIRTGKGK